MLCFNLALLFVVVASSNAYKILGIFTIPAGSHFILASKLFTEIAKNGHEVTFITPRPVENPPANLTQITINSLQGTSPVVKMIEREQASPFEQAQVVNELQYELSKHLLSTKEIQNLMKSGEKFDAVILYYYLNDALLGLAHHFQAPVILFKSMPLYVSESHMLSHPNPSSYVPNILTEYTGRMNFWQRLRNSFYDMAMILYYQWVMLPKHRQLVREYIPGKPDLYEFLNNSSLVLINSHVSTNEAIPMVPNAVEIGGYHIDEPKKLPEHLEKYLNESSNGVILFSMGSIAQSAHFPKPKRDIVIKAFSKLKENVLWKFEDESLLSELPKNVKTMKWVPQSDVLAHPNVKAFISHGGLLSTLESVYHGVPIVGIPIFVDQKMNLALATRYKYAIEVPYRYLTEEKLSHALDQVLNNPEYKENIEKRSRILRDRPIKPLDSVLYWIEYVIRHNGASHLRYPGMDLNWCQRNLLDVVAFVIIMTAAPVFVMVWVLRRCCKGRVKNKTE